MNDFFTKLKTAAGAVPKPGKIIVAVVLLGVVGIWLFSSFNGIQKTMVSKETTLSAKYQDNQNVFSNGRKAIKEAMGVAQTSTAAQNEVLDNAIRGRYEDGSSAKPGSGTAFSAIFEAYPNLDKVAFPYEKVQDAIFTFREQFKNQQTALLDLLRDYDNWRTSGLIHKQMVKIVGAPSDGLEARIGKQVYRGQAALDQIKLIITDSETNESFDSGNEEPLDLGPQTPAPSPAK